MTVKNVTVYTFRDGTRLEVVRLVLVTVLLMSGMGAKKTDIDAIEYNSSWAEPRSQEQLDSEKYAADDVVLEADIDYDKQFNFTFKVFEVKEMVGEFNRVTMRFHVDVIKGRTMDRIFVEVLEANRTADPSKFHFNNLMQLPKTNRTVDIPVPRKFFERWVSTPTGISFYFGAEFGMLSNIRNISALRPVMIFSRTTAPKKCSEFSCCLTSTIYLFSRSPIYFNVVFPEGVRSQRCIDCSKTSDINVPYMDDYNKLIHGQTTVDKIRPLPQRGMCRVTQWGSMPTIFWTEPTLANGTKGPIQVTNAEVPYFNARSCECVDDFDEDYEDLLFSNQGIRLP